MLIHTIWDPTPERLARVLQALEQVEPSVPEDRELDGVVRRLALDLSPARLDAVRRRLRHALRAAGRPAVRTPLTVEQAAPRAPAQLRRRVRVPAQV